MKTITREVADQENARWLKARNVRVLRHRNHDPLDNRIENLELVRLPRRSAP